GPWLQTLQQHNSALREHEYTPLADLQRIAGRPGGTLFDTLLVFENYPVDAAVKEADTRLDVIETEMRNRTHYPLTLTIAPQSSLRLQWEWDGEQLDRNAIERLSADFEAVLHQFATRGECCLGTIEFAEAPATAVVAYPFRAPAERIAAQATLRPEALALCCAGVELSYGALERWSNQVAWRLNRLGAQPDERIGLCAERSVDLAAGLLGILKSGAAFVPLDPAYPEARLREMMEDAGVQRVVVDALTVRQLPWLRGYQQIALSGVADERDTAGHAPVDPEQLAYVIYTSGSTGRPKGVAVSHRALSLHLDDFVTRFSLGEADTMLQFSTLNFDAALDQLLGVLTQGGRVLMRGPDPWDSWQLNQALADDGVTAAYLPAAYWQQWLDTLPATLPALRQLMVGGEALPGDALARWRAGPLGAIRLDNRYGPTEATVTALVHEAMAEDTADAIVPIGRPYPSRMAVILDDDGCAVPAGGIGELCLGGPSLARGYLDRPALTAERFVPNPFVQGARLYRTGDLCRQRADGTVMFLGRLDDQAKIRGYRVEPQEVAARLRTLPGVRAAFVAARPDRQGRPRLVAYAAGNGLDPTAMRQALIETLPEYMVPSVIIVLSSLPLLPNGKIDRRALPEPEDAAPAARVGPRTAAE
ncbi:MAG TPA: amino acid adenylation domain-containing protein, partial [Rhodopila sp.]